MLGVGDSLMKLTWLREMLLGEHQCLDRCLSLPGSHGVQEGNVWFVFPVSLEVTAPVLKSVPSSSRRVPSPAAVGFISCISSPTCRQRFAVSVTAAWSSVGVQVTGAAQTPNPAGTQGEEHLAVLKTR